MRSVLGLLFLCVATVAQRCEGGACEAEDERKLRATIDFLDEIETELAGKTTLAIGDLLQIPLDNIGKPTPMTANDTARVQEAHAALAEMRAALADIRGISPSVDEQWRKFGHNAAFLRFMIAFRRAKLADVRTILNPPQ